MPSVDASVSFQVLDEVTTFTRQGVAGRGTFYLGGSVSQTVFAEPLFANLAIQKLLKESEFCRVQNLTERNFLRCIDLFRKELFFAGMENYCRGKAKLSDFLLNACINCEGQSHLITSLIRDAGINLPNSLQLGTQMYVDHMRPVFFKRSTNEVFDLVYGLVDV